MLQLLYEADLNPGRESEASYDFIIRRMRGRKALSQFAQRLFEGTLLHREQIDRELTRYAANWSLPRMAVTDRNILRLGAYEILVGDTPGRVAINEAVDLARRYGDKNSPRFVNGILDRLLHATASNTDEAKAGDRKSG